MPQGLPSHDAASAKKYYDLGARYTWTIVNTQLARAGKAYVEGLRAPGEVGVGGGLESGSCWTCADIRRGGRVQRCALPLDRFAGPHVAPR